MNKTPNYQLSQWERTDQVRMEDFNSDNAKLDAALKAEADARTAAVAAINTALPKKGNCSVGFLTYSGTGTNTTVIDFPRKPLAFIAVGFGGALFGWGSQNVAYIVSGADAPVVWNGSQFRFTTSYGAIKQLNSQNSTYYVLAFYAES